MSRNGLRYGVIGCAGMGSTHADALERIDDLTLVACADVVEANARQFADEYDCAWYTDHVEMIEDADLDAVSVCTPNGTHAEIVAEVADANAHVLCEKPLDVRRERVDRLIDACAEAGVKLGCIYQRRTLGEARLARDAVQSGALGELIVADVQVKWHRESPYYEDTGWHGTADLDGGVLLTQALHGIDLLQWIAGDVDRVCAAMDTFHHDIEVPDTAVLNLQFDDGAYGQVSATTAVQPQYPITLQFHGTEGSIRFHEGGVDAYETGAGAVDYTLEDFPLGRGHVGQLRDFSEAIREDRDPMVPPAEARKAPDIVFAAEEAAASDEWTPVHGRRD